MYEASDDRNQAFGLSVLGAAWGCGLIIGPALSGALADPIGQYNLTITSEDEMIGKNGRREMG